MKRLKKKQQGGPVEDYRTSHVYRGPQEFDECEGEGCSEQATKKVANLFGVDYNTLGPQDAWYKRKAVLNTGGKEVYNTSSKKKLDTAYADMRIGDFVSLDRSGSPHINDKSKAPGYTLADNEGTEHEGFIVGFDERGMPLVRHGHSGGLTKAKSFVQPIDKVSLPDLGLNYSVKSIYRAGSLLDAKDPKDQRYYRESKPVVPIGFSDAAKITKDKQKFVDAYNKNSGAFQTQSGLDPEEVAAIGSIAYGIFGNESNFNDSLKRIPKQLAATILHKLHLKDSAPSLGPTQIKYDDLSKNADDTVNSKGKIFQQLGVDEGELKRLKSNYDEVTKSTFGNLAENYKKMKKDPAYEYNPETNTVFGNVPIGYALARSWKQPNLKVLKDTLRANDSDYSKAAYQHMIELNPQMFPSTLPEVVVTPQKKKRGGAVSRTGYLSDSPDRFNEFNVIPSNQITMKGVNHKVKGVDNLGNEIMMLPGQDYTFPGQYVTETPVFQDGGGIDDGNYQSAATLAYYKEKLNNKLKAKNPEAFANYFKGLVDLRRSGKSTDADKYVQETAYNDYLSNEEVQQELGEEYPVYLDSLKRVNQYNVQQGKQPLYGTNEEDQDISKLNYGRRFASLMVTPSYTRTNTTRNTNYARNYSYSPEQGVNYTETGDMALNPFKKQYGGSHEIPNFGLPGFDDKGLVYGSNPNFVTKRDTDMLGMGTSAPAATPRTRKPRSAQSYVDGAFSGLIDSYLDPGSLYNATQNIGAVGEFIGGIQDRRYQRNRLQDAGMTDNIFAENQQQDRGNYVNSGTSYGMFRPDEMGSKSPDGMYNGMYYPTMQDGGSAKIKNDGSFVGKMGSDFMNYMNRPDVAANVEDFKRNGKAVTKAIINLVDPTGVTNYDDVYNDFKNDKSVRNKVLDVAGALPFIGGKVKLAGKAIKVAEGLPKMAGLMGDFFNMTEDMGADWEKTPKKQMGGPKSGPDYTDKRGNVITDGDLAMFKKNTGIQWGSKEEYADFIQNMSPVPQPSGSKLTYPFGKRGETMTQDEWDFARSKGGYPDVYSDHVQGTDNFIPGEIYSNEIRNHIKNYRNLTGTGKMAYGGLIPDEITGPGFLGNTSTREMYSEPLPEPAFMDIPVGLAPRKSFEMPNVNGNLNVDINESTKTAYDYYVKEKKLPSHIAAGIVGNLYQESGLKPGAVEKTNTANGRGIAQWDVRDRWQGYLSWANQNDRNAYDLKSQLDYVLVEPGESANALKKLKNSTTAAEAAVIFGRLYERPSEKHANWNKRTSIANKLQSGQFEDGGEYEMTDQEIQDLRNQGFNVELI